MKYELITVSTAQGKFTINYEGTACRVTYHLKGKDAAFIHFPATGDRHDQAMKLAGLMYGVRAKSPAKGYPNCTPSEVDDVKNLLEKFLP